MQEKSSKSTTRTVLYLVQRFISLFVIIALFLPSLNPAKVCKLVDGEISMLTVAVSYSSLTDGAGYLLRTGEVNNMIFIVDYIGAIIALIGVLFLVVGGCLSFGNHMLQRKALKTCIISSIIQIVGYVACLGSYFIAASDKANASSIGAQFPIGAVLFIVTAIVLLLLSAVIMSMTSPAIEGEKADMAPKYKLFLMALPFLAMAFVFCYLPLWGWRYAFFDYNPGDSLTMSNFVGFKWFTYLFQNAATRADVIRVIRNTLAMSFLGLIFQWIPMAFAIFLCEIKNLRFRRFVQTFTTIPNFISWVLVYAIAFAIFSTDGFINTAAANMGLIHKTAEGIVQGKNYLNSSSHIWIKMWAWGCWKGVGWSAIIYIAGIAGIDQQLYEAATVDGAGRFQRMWHVTVPGLLPTFFVLFLMAVAGILSNGLDQYLVFCNATNKSVIEVLDLYVYYLGLGEGGSIPLSTVVGMFKSVISVILLFGANSLSKALRGESII